MHRLLSPPDYLRMPWKNGGGWTTEIALHPPGAAADAFDWRVSVAEVAANGPFSRCPGVDRTIVLIDGRGMRLAGDGHAAELRTPFEPYAFSGDDGVDCALVDGPVRDYNLMLRRGRVQGQLIVVREGGTRIAPARFVVCYAAHGAVECLLPAHAPVSLAADHALVVDDEGGVATSPVVVNPLSGDAVALVAAIALAP